mgnify:CR=1 FL=1
MSFLVSDVIQEMQLELNILGQAMDDDDFILFLNKSNEYLGTAYKMPTTERLADLLLFNGVNEYELPDDFAGIIEPQRPYGIHSPNFDHETTREFMHWPYGYKTTLRFDQDSQFLVANITEGDRFELNNCDSLTENGTWAVSGDGSALALDNQIYTEGTGSLRFTITDSIGTTTLTCNAMAYPIDISSVLNQGWLFLDLQSPSSTAISSVQIRIGSDSTNYYQMSATTRYRGNTITQGWGLIGFDLSQKTTVGTPDYQNIDYIQIVIANGLTGTSGTYRLDNIFLSEAVYFQLPYYSQYNVKGDDGTYKAQITETGDTVLCPNGPEFKSAFTYKTLEIANAMRFKDASAAEYCARELAPREAYLKAKYPRQESKPATTWYKGWRFKGNGGVWRKH